MAAIMFSEVVVSHDPFVNRLLFHELVHVEQYRFFRNEVLVVENNFEKCTVISSLPL
jgi:hypothetical protein